MSGADRTRMMSQSSSSSSDSSCLDPAYATIDVESCQNLITSKTRSGSYRGEKSSGRRCSLAVVSLVISVVCLATLIGSLMLFYLFVYSSEDFLSGEERVCLPCDQVSPNPLEDIGSSGPRQLDVHLADDGETEICCASTPAQYAKFFKLILQRQEGVKKLADIMGSDNDVDDDADGDGVMGRKAVSAHLLAKPHDPHWRTVQRWKSSQESPVSHVRGLRFHNNTLIVQTPGLYFIYCQILFNRAPGGEDPASPTLASHYVKRSSLLYPATSGILLKARHTRVSGHDDRHSSYVGGLFFLHTGDKMYVQVSVPELVSNDDRASFFGLFRVGR